MKMPISRDEERGGGGITRFSFKLFQTLAFRLTLWYAGIFSLSSCAAFLLFYFLVSQTILNRVDQDLLDKAGLFSAVLSVQGIQGVKKLAVLEARAAGEKKIFFRLLYPSGEVFASSHMDYWNNINVKKEAIGRLINRREAFFETVSIDRDLQKVRVLYYWAAPGVVLQTGLSMDTYGSFMAAFKRMFAGAMAIVVLASAMLGGFMSKKALSGLAEVTRTAREISGSSLSSRVPESGHQDELNELARTFNQMLDRIETLVKNIREMSDNIAHDLKSPITRIRGLAEITLLDGGSQDDFESMAASTIEEADRLLDMINTMLVISRTEAGVGGLQFQPVNISELVTEACQLFEAVAEDAGIEFQYSSEPDLFCYVDRGMLQRALANVIDNAITYTPASGRVWVDLRRTGSTVPHGGGTLRRGRSHAARNLIPTTINSPHVFSGIGGIEIEVSDTGQGIAPEHLDKIFERFYRADPSRNLRGTGLGLSFARTIVREHGGELIVSSTPGQGSQFLLILPHGNFPVI